MISVGEVDILLVEDSSPLKRRTFERDKHQQRPMKEYWCFDLP